MTYQEDNNNLGEIVLDDHNQGRKCWTCLGQTCSGWLIVFLSQLFVNSMIIFSCFWRIHFSKSCGESTVWVGFLCWRQNTFYPHQDYEQVKFYKKTRFFSLVGPSETRKLQLRYNWLKIGTFQPKIDKVYFFYQHSQPLYDVIQKENENLEFVREVKLNLLVR